MLSSRLNIVKARTEGAFAELRTRSAFSCINPHAPARGESRRSKAPFFPTHQIVVLHQNRQKKRAGEVGGKARLSGLQRLHALLADGVAKRDINTLDGTPSMRIRLRAMNTIRLFALVPMLLSSACSFTGGGRGVSPSAVVLTQVAPEPIATCLGQAAGTTPVADGNGGFRVDAAGTGSDGPAYLLVIRDKVQTEVRAPGAPEDVPSGFRAAALKCVMQLTPPSNSVAH
jgi:hypothetical protein